MLLACSTCDAEVPHSKHWQHYGWLPILHILFFCKTVWLLVQVTAIEKQQNLSKKIKYCFYGLTLLGGLGKDSFPFMSNISISFSLNKKEEINSITILSSSKVQGKIHMQDSDAFSFFLALLSEHHLAKRSLLVWKFYSDMQGTVVFVDIGADSEAHTSYPVHCHIMAFSHLVKATWHLHRNLWKRSNCHRSHKDIYLLSC